MGKEAERAELPKTIWRIANDLRGNNQRLRAELRQAKATTAMLEWLVAGEALETRLTPPPGEPPGPPTLRPVP